MPSKLRRLRKVRDEEAEDSGRESGDGNVAQAGSNRSSPFKVRDEESGQESSGNVALADLATSSSPSSNDRQAAAVCLKRKFDEGTHLEDENGDVSRASADHPATCSQKQKKLTRKEIEEMHAQSQKLLRDTAKVAFERASVVGPSISRLLSKLRERKAQLGWKASTQVQVIRKDAELHDGSDELHGENDELHSEDDELHGGNDELHNENDELHDEDFSANSEDENTTQKDQNPLDSSGKLDIDCSNTSSPDPMLDDQLQNEAPGMDLHLGSVSQRFQAIVKKASDTMKPQVMALVDCEAEEEEDDDCLAKDSEEEEDDDDEQVLEIIEPSVPEADADVNDRVNLHRQWLDEQDHVQTDDILWRLVEKGRSVPAPNKLDEDAVVNGERVRSSQKHLDILVKENHDMLLDHGSEESTYAYDDEEVEGQTIRQSLMAATSVHEAFLSPADDESCRQMMGLIKKVNVAVPRNRSMKDAYNTAGGVHTLPKPAFVNRAAASLLKHSVAISSRSFVFGRDENFSVASNVSAEKLVVKNAGAHKNSRGPSLHCILGRRAGGVQSCEERSLVTEKIAMFRSKLSFRKVE